MSNILTAAGNIAMYRSGTIGLADNQEASLALDSSGRLLTSASGTVSFGTVNAGTITAVGNVADQVADSGNPVKVGGKYNVTLPTYTDGQRGDLQIGQRGGLRVQLIENAGTFITGQADNGDAVAVTSSLARLAVLNRNTVYNGTTWDRQYGNTTGTYVIDKPTTTGGYLVYRNLDLQSTGILILTGVRQLYGGYIANLASSVRYVKLYNKATAPTVGTDTPTHTLAIPANSAAVIEFSKGIPFSLGLGIGGVTGVADSSTAAPTANDIVVNLNYF